MKKLVLLAVAALAFIVFGDAPSERARSRRPTPTPSSIRIRIRICAGDRSVRTRGGRSTAAAGVRTQPNVFYMGATGGGVWKTENYGITWSPVSDGQIPTGSIGALDVADSNPNVVYAGTGSEAIRSNVIVGPRRLQVDRRGQDVAVRWPEGSRPDRPAERSIRRIRTSPTSRRSATRSAGGRTAASIAPRMAARPGRRCCSSTIRPAWCRSRSTGRIPTRSTPARGAGSASRGRSSAAAPAAEGGVYKTTDGGDHWTRVGNGFPDDLIGKVWVDVAQSNPKVVYAQVEAKGAKGGLYRTRGQRRDAGRYVNSSQALRARPFYFNKVFVNPKDENDVWVTELGLPSFDRRRQDLRQRHRRRTATTTSSGSIRTTRSIFIETNDGGANITQDGGAQLVVAVSTSRPRRCIMVDADEQFPYHIYGPQQDTGKNLGGAEPAADVVGTGRPAPAMGAVAGLRERPGAADSIGQDRLRRLQGRVRPHERRRPARSRNTGSTRSSATARTAEGDDVPLRAAVADRNRRAQSEHRLPRLAVRAQNDRRRRALDEVQSRRDGERTGGPRRSRASRSPAT